MKKLAKAQMGKIVKKAAKYAIPEQGAIKKAIKKGGDYDIDKYKNIDISSTTSRLMDKIKKMDKSQFINKEYIKLNPEMFKKLVTKPTKTAVANDVAKKAAIAGAGAAAGYAAGSKKKMGGSTKTKSKK
jgi:uncharacterized protein (UPF0305 family)